MMNLLADFSLRRLIVELKSNTRSSTHLRMYLRRLLFLWLASLSWGHTSVALASDTQVNFVEISIDDLKRVIGYVADEPGSFLRKIYPDDEVRQQIRSVLTPNIDALAADSLVFTNAHAAAPICNASRVALMTGLRPDQTGVTENEQIFRKVPGGDSLITIPQRLKDAGYFTTGIGKFFHRPKVTLKANDTIGSDWPDSLNSWSHWVNRDAGSARVYTKAPYSLISQMKINFGVSKLELDDEHDIINSSFMGELLREDTATIYDLTYKEDVTVSLPAESPFYIGVGVLLPHEPFIAPSEILDLFNEDDIHLTAENIQEVIDDVTDLSQGGKGFATVSLSNGKLGGDFQKLLAAGNFIHSGELDGDIRAWKSAIKHYLAAVAVADRSVGRVLDGLANSPYKDNTVVIIHSDHGFHLGEKNRFGKNTLWDEATGSVLIIHKPGAAGAMIRNNVSLLDIFPTVMSLAGIASPDYIRGQDLSMFFLNSAAMTTGPSVTTHGSAANRQSIRTNRYRYIQFKGDLGNAELYDTAVDPHSLTNLIDSPAHYDLKLALEELLEKSFASDASTPVMLRPTDMDTPLGATVDNALSAWHANGESLSYGAINLPSGVSLDESTGIISGSPTVPGMFYPEVSASSVSGTSTMTFAWNISAGDTSLPYWSGGLIQVGSQDTDSLSISWTGAENTQELAGYRVTVDDQQPINVVQPMLSVNGLHSGQLYSIAVQSVDLSGNVSIDGPTLNVTLDSTDFTPPSWSADATILIADVTMTTANVSWLGAYDTNGISQYQIYLTDSFGTTTSLSSDVNSISLIGLLPDSIYTVLIEAMDESANQSTNGPEQSFTTLPEAQTGGSDQLQLTINGVTLTGVLESASGQDYGPATIEYQDEGQTVSIIGNAWKRMTIDYPVTSDTIISFDFWGTEEAKVHAIGFEKDYVVSSSSTLQLWGTHRFGKQHYRNYDDSVGQVVSYVIPVGEIIPAGFYEYITFISDQDVGPYDAASKFSNISIYDGELTDPDMPPAWGIDAEVLATAIDTDSATLTWESAIASPDRIISYQVYIDSVLHTSTTATSLTLELLTESTMFDVEVVANDDLGNTAINSLVTQFRTADVPPYWLSGSTIQLSGITMTSAQITWPAAISNTGGPLTYTVLLDNAVYAMVTGTQINIENLDPSIIYIATLQVRDGNGLQSSDTLTIELRTGDEAPYWTTGSHIQASNVTYSSATIEWPAALSNVGNSLQYDIMLNNVFISQQASNTLTLNQLSPSSTNVVRITATDDTGTESINSLTAQFETADTPPYWQSGQQITVAEISAQSANLTWDDATSDAGNAISYHVFIDDTFFTSTQQPTLLLDNLLPGTNVSVGVTAMDDVGNPSSNNLATQFETLISESSISIIENGVARFAFIQGFGVQDKTGELQFTDRGQTLTMTGNRWQYLVLDTPASSDTVVEFNFESTSEGGIHGIAIENDVYPSASKTFKLFGNKTFGIRTFENYDPSMGVVRYTIPIGQVTGMKKFLVFITDHDVANPTAHSVFSDIVIRSAGGDS